MQQKSLAQFINEKREELGITQNKLAELSGLPINIIEEIESGQELFLPSTTRQKLAKGLKLMPKEIKPYEKQLDEFKPQSKYIEEIKEKIFAGKTDDLLCPVCKEKLICRVAEMYDLEDHLILHPKARCSKCPFQIK